MPRLLSVFILLISQQLGAQAYYHIKRSGALPEGYYLDKIYTADKLILLNEPSLSTVSDIDSLPFEFDFFGQKVKKYRVSDNGYLSFDISNTNSETPAGELPKNSISPFWQDYKLQKLPPPNEGVGIQVFSYTVGTAPERSHIVQFHGLSLQDDPLFGPISNSSIYAFAIIFHEADSGRFDMVYTPYGNKELKGLAGCRSADGTQTKLINDSAIFLPFQFSFSEKDFIVYQFIPGEQKLKDIEISSIKLNDVYQTNAIVNITGTLVNVGSMDISACEVSYSVGEGDTITHQFNSLQLKKNGEGKFQFSHPISWLGGINGSLNSMHIWVSGIDTGLDQNPQNSHYYKVILRNSLNYTANRNILVEEATGAWCGYCPEAHIIIKSVQQLYGARIIPISYHFEDSMSFPDGNVLLSRYFTSYPDAMLDRKVFLGSTNTWREEIESRLNGKSPVSIAITNKSFNASTREIKFTVKLTFSDFWYGKMNLGAMVTEDKVRGNALPNLWSQNNYYSKDHNGGVGGILHPLYEEKEFMDGYLHHHVLRAVYGGLNGFANSIPLYVSPGSTYTRDFSYFLPPATKVSYQFENNTPFCSTLDDEGLDDGGNVPNNIHLIGYVAQMDSSELQYYVLNSGSEYLWNPVNILSARHSKVVPTAYPNPVYGDKVRLHLPANWDLSSLQISLLNLNDSEIIPFIQSEASNHSLILNLDEIPSGMYLIKLQDGIQQYTLKIVFE